MYGTAYRGIYDQSLVLTEDFKQMLDKTSQNTVMPPQQAVLNKDNIILYERAILDAYKISPESKYKLLKNALFWGIMHGGIQKFCVEYNGIMLQTINPLSFELELLPF